MNSFWCRIGGKMAHYTKNRSRFHLQALKIINTEGCKIGNEEQGLVRVKGERKRKGKSQEQKIKSGQQKKSKLWLMRKLQSKTMYILVPNPQGNLAPR